jgi:glycosyltransferase involved in cell wall biosynthesis
MFLIFSKNFYPSFRSGGVSTSAYNLYSELKNDLEVHVISTNKDGIELIPQSEIRNVKGVFYSSTYTDFLFHSLGALNRSRVVYLNDLFSVRFFLFPLLYIFFFRRGLKIVICTHGMLNSSALQRNRILKRIFLSFERFFINRMNCLIHLTSSKEKEYHDVWLNRSDYPFIIQAPLVPKPELFERPNKPDLILTYYSVIAKKKNLDRILYFLLEEKRKIVLNIAGPVKESDYWRICMNLINQLQQNITVNILGSLSKEASVKLFKESNLVFLPSSYENFGYVVYEALSNGVPVVISQNLPWASSYREKQLDYLIVNLEAELFNFQVNEILNKIESMSEYQYIELCEKCYLMSLEFYENQDLNSFFNNLKNN